MDKCLQFRLPSGAGGMAAQMTAGKIKNKLNELHSSKKIGLFKTSHEKHYKMNIWLENEYDYTTILLLWERQSVFSDPILVERPSTENPFTNKT